jgi:hypothetical protein
MMRFRRFACAFLLLALLGAPLSACSNATKSSNAAGLDDSIQALAGGGVAVMDDVTSTAPIDAIGGTPSAMRFTRRQVQNLVAEANAHNGYTGAELDGFIPAPSGAPPLSVLIGAWLTKQDGALAAYAQKFMGAQDYKQAATIVFPSIVVLTFVADIARMPAAGAQATPTAIDIGPWIASPAEADGDACTDISNWVSSVVTNIQTAVTSNGPSWLQSIANTVVMIAGQAFSVVANGVLQSTVGFVTEIATVVGTLMQVATMFKQWTVNLAADPAALTLGAAPLNGAFNATLDAQDIQWPQSLAGCVKSLSGVDLSVPGYKDAAVTWKQPVGIPTFASPVTQDATLAGDKTAHYKYSTITKEPATDCPALVPSGKVGITVTVVRTDVSKALNSLLLLITNKLPSQLQSILQPFEQQGIDKVQSTIGDFNSPHATATTQLSELVADPGCTHTPPPTSAPSATLAPSQHGHLPMGPCTQIVNSGDASAGYPGDSIMTNLPPALAATVHNTVAMLNAMSQSAGTGNVTNDQRALSETGCAIGPPGQSMSEDDENNIKMDVIFITVPADPGEPIDPTNSNPVCLAALGTYLTKLDAQCMVLSSSDIPGSATIMVQGSTADYLVVGTSGGSGPPINILRSVLRRLSE